MGYPDEAEAEENNPTHTSGIASCASSISANSEATAIKPVQLWKRALKKLQSVDLDPWIDFPTHNIHAQTAVRHRYSVIKKKWVVDEILVKIERVPFDRGAMRECFRLKKIPQTGIHANDWHFASNYVAKRYITNVNKQVYFDDVRLQMEAKLWGEAFNRQNPPKKVDIFQLSVLELTNNKENARSPSDSGGAADSATESSEQSPVCFYHIERYMEGEYRKYNSNSGFVDEQLRNTPQAFSHFTFERSGHRLLVVDIQGVGDLYTDPQIHTADGVGYSDGNLGPRGMALFFHSHRCNPLCEWLGLTPFDLAPSELGCDSQGGVELAPHKSANESAEAVGQKADKQVTACNGDHADTHAHPAVYAFGEANVADTSKPISQSGIFGARGLFHRRRAVSFNQQSARCYASRFGPTVARSTENMQHNGARMVRQRSESLSLTPDDHQSYNAGLVLFNGSSLSNLLDPDDFDTASIGPFTTLKLDTATPAVAEIGQSNLANSSFSHTPPMFPNPDDQFHRPLYTVDPFPIGLPRRSRDRAASGDSGYSGRVNLLSAAAHWSDAEFPLQTAAKSSLMSSVSAAAAAAAAHSHADFPTGTLIHSGLLAGSLSSLNDYSVPASPVAPPPTPPILFQAQFSLPANHLVHSAGAGSGLDDFASGWTSFGHTNSVGCWNLHGWSHALGSRAVFGPAMLPRRRRNLSESSDLDLDEDHRVTGNLLHQLMHENHKPSCADHPTNLDQEIGHSILGQIHHELARLHEAGRFLPNCKGGWSHAGLGGLLLQNHCRNGRDDEQEDEEHEDGDSDVCPNEIDLDTLNDEGLTDCHLTANIPEHSIDWHAVLFHERHAAQLGCLEAMIVMAHYYLGLPTQLMLDCPIKPNQSDLRSGVDYLGRAAEGGDRRCMILLARFLDVSASLSDSEHSVSKTTNPDDFLLLPALTSASPDAVPLISSDPWAEAVTWYKKAVDTAGTRAPEDGTLDEGLDAEGRYDAAEDLLPVYRILARMAEMYSIGGFGLKQDSNKAGDLFNQAGELASSARQGRLAAKYFELGEEAYANCE